LRLKEYVPLEGFYNTIRALEDFVIEDEIENILRNNSEYVIELLQEQLKQGQSGDGPTTVFGSTQYNPQTVKYKLEFGQGTGRITSFITNFMFGDFYGQMFLEVDNGLFTIKSSVSYFDKILDQSGETVMQLNQESLERLRDEIILPELEQVINTKFAQ